MVGTATRFEWSCDWGTHSLGGGTPDTDRPAQLRRRDREQPARILRHPDHLDRVARLIGSEGRTRDEISSCSHIDARTRIERVCESEPDTLTATVKTRYRVSG